MRESDRPVLVARVGAAIGLRGELRLQVFLADATDVGAYGPLTTRGGRTLVVRSQRPLGDKVGWRAVVFDSVADRTAAEALTGEDLFVARERLPTAGADEFYHADLVGLEVARRGGERFGEVVAVHNFGAGDLLEIRSAEGTVLLPFTRDVVPEVDLARRRLVVDPPADAEEVPE